jgi:hypothetical protein
LGVNILYVKTSIHYNFLQVTEKRQMYGSWQHVVKTDNHSFSLYLTFFKFMEVIATPTRNENVWLVFVYEHCSP